MLFPLVTSLAILPCEARKAKLLITGVHNKSNEVHSHGFSSQSFINFQIHCFARLRGGMNIFELNIGETAFSPSSYELYHNFL